MNRFQKMISELEGCPQSLQPVVVTVTLLRDLYEAGLVQYKVDAYVPLKSELVAQLAVISPHWAEQVSQLSLFDRRQMVEIPGLS